MRRPTLVLLLILALAPAPAAAEGFTRITDRSAFAAAVQGRNLTSTAVRLTVHPDGVIEGRAFGFAVTGTWDWQDGYFCRTLATAARDFPLNCQKVETDGATIRFTADKGTGETASLRINRAAPPSP